MRLLFAATAALTPAPAAAAMAATVAVVAPFAALTPTAPAAAELIAVAFALAADDVMAATLTLAAVAASTNRSR